MKEAWSLSSSAEGISVRKRGVTYVLGSNSEKGVACVPVSLIEEGVAYVPVSPRE